jgi:hypothetical protein
MKKIFISLVTVATIVNACFPAGVVVAAFNVGSYGSFGTTQVSGSSNGSFGSTGVSGSGSTNTGSFGSTGISGFGSTNISGSGSTGSFGNTTVSGGSSAGFGQTTIIGNTNNTNTFGTTSINGYGGTSIVGTPVVGGPTNTGSFGSTGISGFGSTTITPIPTPISYQPPVFGGTTVTDTTTTGGGGTTCAAPFAQTLAATNVTQTGATFNGIVIPNSNRNTATYWFEYGTYTGGLTRRVPATIVASLGSSYRVSATVSDLQSNVVYQVRLGAQNTCGLSYGQSVHFTTSGNTQQGSAPQVVTNNASAVSANSATIAGSINPNGFATTYWFEYGTTNSLGQTTNSQSLGSGNYNQSVFANLNNLAANTTYYFRAVAQNQYGTTRGATLSFTTNTSVQYQPTLTISPANATVSQNQSTVFTVNYDPDGSSGPQAPYTVSNSATWNVSDPNIAARTSGGTFTGINPGTTQIIALYAGLTAYASLTVTYVPPTGSQPTVQTNAATNIGQNSAVVNGTVNPNSAATSYWFEYGTNANFGYTTGNQSAGAGSSAVSASASLSGLSTNTTYYFRAVAQNQYGTSYGQTLTFVTSQSQQGNAPSVQTNSATGVSTNSATINGTVNPNGYTTNYWFEYGTTNSLGQATTQQSIGSGTQNQAVFINSNNLVANTTYYFRVVAQNQYGISYGSILNFTTTGGGNQGTAPVAQTNSASNVTVSSATVNGNINPNGYNTTYWFEYGTNTSLGQTTQFQSLGSNSGSLSVNANIYGLAANTTYYFRVVAQNQYGTSYGQILNFQTGNGGGIYGSAPYAQTNQVTGVGNTYATFNGSVSPNNADTYSWFEYGVNPGSLVYTTNSNYVGSGNGATNVSQNATNLTGNTTYYYRIVARNNNGTSYGSVVSFNTLGGGYNPTTGNAPIVTTRPANYVYQNSALLSGEVNPNGGTASGWFEYGLTTSLGLTTGQQPVGTSYSTGNIVYALSGLLPNTTYYFRAVAQNQYGTSYGQILSFRSTATTVIDYYPPQNPPVVQPPVVIYSGPTGTQECVFVNPAANVVGVDAGEEFVLTVTYINQCKYPITNATLRIMLPAEVQFISADNPYFVREGNTVTFNLGTIPAQGQGTITIRAKVADDVNSGATLLINHTLGFNDNRGNYRAVNSLLTLTVDKGYSLLASLFEFLSKLFGYCWFWILLALIILLIILFLMYRALAGNRTTTEVRRVDIMNHQ